MNSPLVTLHGKRLKLLDLPITFPSQTARIEFPIYMREKEMKLY